LVGRMAWSVGRAQDCSIFLPDRMVSREHAMILQMPRSNEFFWVDLGSRNGSFINFQPVKQPMQLQDGDLIRVGNRLEIQFILAPDSVRLPHGVLTVLMHQSSLFHGQLWREVLMALQISIIWQPNDVSLFHSLRQLEATGGGLPHLLLIDAVTLKDDFSAFMEAMTAAFPPIPVMFTMAEGADDFLGRRAQAQAHGAIDLIPLFRLAGADFLDYRDDFARKVALVLKALGAPMPHHDSLLTAAAAALRTALRNETLF
jgi:FHA domain